MSAAKKHKSDEELISELRQFHHYEAAKRIEQLKDELSAPTASAEITSGQRKP